MINWMLENFRVGEWCVRMYMVMWMLEMIQNGRRYLINEKIFDLIVGNNQQ